MKYMAYLIACLTAALSYVLNRRLFRSQGLAAIAGWGPLVEESAKTLPAYFLDADIWATHLAFGIIEAIYDWRTNGRSGAAAGLASLIGHGLFGGITVMVLDRTASIFWGWLAGLILHWLWNVSVIKLCSKG